MKTVVRPTIEPTLADVRRSQIDSRTVPISCEIPADLDTPVSAYLKIRRQGPSFLLESVEGGEQLGRYSFIGAAPRRILRIREGKRWFESGETSPCSEPLSVLQDLAAEYSTAPRLGSRFAGGMLGYLSYEAATYFERLPRAAQNSLDLPDAIFMDIDTFLVFDHVAHSVRVVSHAHLEGSLESEYRAAVERIESLVGMLEMPLNLETIQDAVAGSVHSNLSQHAYESMVARTKEHIFAGDILQGVVSQRLSMSLSGDPFAVYRRLRRVSPSPFMYFLDFGDHQLIGASPELLLQVDGRRVSTRPIAGTRPRGSSIEEDRMLAESLLADEKERAEHLMLVDLARNDLGRVSVPGSVRVAQFMGIERFSHVMHLASDVVGELRSECNAFDALRSVFPAGTVSGAPKIRAMEIIADLEQEARGPYAGAVGFVSGTSAMEMAITIRTAVVVSGHLHVQAGAGIVADSDPATEYAETMNKARGLLRAAGEER